MHDDARAPDLQVHAPRSTLAEAHASLRVLSLTGGGFRGLFTAQVLVELCRLADRRGPLDASIDVFAGTSIGGVVACALAVGATPQRVLDAIDLHGPSIFPDKRAKGVRRGLFGSLYDRDRLAEAVDDCLGPHRFVKLKDVEHGLVVPAVDWLRGRVEVYRSGWFGAAFASDVTLRDACMATSAAPTFFDPADVQGLPMLDGGLAVNNPDVLALLEVVRRSPADLARLEMLSIGTAGAAPSRWPDRANRSGLGWAPDLATFMIDVQERTAAAQAAGLLGDRYLRIDHAGSASTAFEKMDVATDAMRTALRAAGREAATLAHASAGAFVRRFLEPSRRPTGS